MTCVGPSSGGVCACLHWRVRLLACAGVCCCAAVLWFGRACCVWARRRPGLCAWVLLGRLAALWFGFACCVCVPAACASARLPAVCASAPCLAVLPVCSAVRRLCALPVVCCLCARVLVRLITQFIRIYLRYIGMAAVTQISD